MIGCPVVCDEVVCLKRVRNNNVNVLWSWWWFDPFEQVQRRREQDESLWVMHEWWRIVYVMSTSDFDMCWSSLSRNKNFNSCEFLCISLAALVRKIWINEARGKIDGDRTVLPEFEGGWCDRKHHFISGYEELAIGLGRGCSWCFKRLQLLFWLFFFI